MSNTWEEVAGKRCFFCGGFATHIKRCKTGEKWNDHPICCDCHGGRWVTQDEARHEHYRVFFEKEEKKSCKIPEK